MKLISLTQGKFTKVDDEDYEFLNQWKWQADKSANTFYAIRSDYSNGANNPKKIKMHRLLLGINETKVITDHIDRDGLNNQKHNLRIATPSQNCANVKSRKNSTSKYVGVSWFKITKRSKKWKAQITKGGKVIHLGIFESEEEAAIAYNNKAKELHGDFAFINVIESLSSA